MSGKAERAMSLVLTVCAVVFAVILIKREFIDRDPGTLPRQESAAPEQVANWQELRSRGLSLGSPSAAIIVVEFADLECPACKTFHMRLKKTAADLRVDVGLVIVHYPLSIHRFARPAARALECANSLGAGARFVDVAYAKQDSFGLKSWASYAQEAGVRDTATFAACARDTARVERVEQGRLLGESMKVRGTPLVIINGWRFSNVPNDTDLREIIKALMRGEPPPGTST